MEAIRAKHASIVGKRAAPCSRRRGDQPRSVGLTHVSNGQASVISEAQCLQAFRPMPVSRTASVGVYDLQTQHNVLRQLSTPRKAYRNCEGRPRTLRQIGAILSTACTHTTPLNVPVSSHVRKARSLTDSQLCHNHASQGLMSFLLMCLYTAHGCRPKHGQPQETCNHTRDMAKQKR